jgi:hypothetical protein
MSEFAISTTERRVFGLDFGDWSMLLGGSVLIVVVALLVWPAANPLISKGAGHNDTLPN